MNKQEFIDRLRSALNGRIPTVLVEDTINYYQDYINAEIRSGKSEAEVMSVLGDPRLIARTIVETAQSSGNNNSSNNASGSYQEDAYRNSSRAEYNSYQNADRQATSKNFRLPGWLLAVIGILVLILLISVVFSVLSFLAPVIIVIVAVVFLVKLFRDWLN